ncbi:MAG: TerB family tellurite resistance protein [Flavobacteriales bacterium]|nr:TerB family tellurite resistance protein [Flavobacteriales bacterium]
MTKAELDVVKRFFRQQFGEGQAQQLLLVMRDVLKREIPVHQVCLQVRQYMPHPARLQLMHYLIGLAHADGRVDRSELDMLRRIAAGLGVNERDLGSMSAMFGRGDIDSAYCILEVDPKASDDEVKKAYRRMALNIIRTRWAILERRCSVRPLRSSGRCNRPGTASERNEGSIDRSGMLRREVTTGFRNFGIVLVQPHHRTVHP